MRTMFQIEDGSYRLGYWLDQGPLRVSVVVAT